MDEQEFTRKWKELTQRSSDEGKRGIDVAETYALIEDAALRRWGMDVSLHDSWIEMQTCELTTASFETIQKRKNFVEGELRKHPNVAEVGYTSAENMVKFKLKY